ncbi:hypothetical protein ACFX13_039991 [Malus domestica]
MGSEGNHSTQNDTLLAPSAKERKKEGKRVALQAKVDELKAQNNKIAMNNKIDRLNSTDDLYTIRQKPDESLRKYASHFSHEYSRCAEADDKTSLNAFTIGHVIVSSST